MRPSNLCADWPSLLILWPFLTASGRVASVRTSMFSYSSENLEKRLQGGNTGGLEECAAFLALEPNQDSTANGPSRRPDFQESLHRSWFWFENQKITSVDHGLRTHPANQTSGGPALSARSKRDRRRRAVRQKDRSQTLSLVARSEIPSAREYHWTNHRLPGMRPFGRTHC